MTLSEIKQQAQNHKGMTMTASTFRWAFKKGMKELNQLVNDGTFTVDGQDKDGNKIYIVN